MTDQNTHHYREIALRWAQAVRQPDRADQIQHELHALYRTLRTTAEGRQSISLLLNDREPAVRVMAATHSLEWQEAEAEAVLEALAAGRRLYAVNALWALRSHRAGHLQAILAAL